MLDLSYRILVSYRNVALQKTLSSALALVLYSSTSPFIKAITKKDTYTHAHV